MLKFNVITDIVAIQLIRSNLPSENSVYNSIEFSFNLHSSRYIFLKDNFLVIYSFFNWLPMYRIRLKQQLIVQHRSIDVYILKTSLKLKHLTKIKCFLLYLNRY